jgi:hypothetical protein
LAANEIEELLRKAQAGGGPAPDSGLNEGEMASLLNQGGNLWGFRTQQDVLLQYLIARWGAADPPPVSFTPTNPLTDTIRNDILVRTKAGGG